MILSVIALTLLAIFGIIYYELKLIKTKEIQDQQNYSRKKYIIDAKSKKDYYRPTF